MCHGPVLVHSDLVSPLVAAAGVAVSLVVCVYGGGACDDDACDLLCVVLLVVSSDHY